MGLRKINNILHRDIGYFFVFMTIVYALSGVALNHTKDWNPDFQITKKEISLDLPKSRELINEKTLITELKRIGEFDKYLMTDYPSKNKIKVYYKNGSLLIDIKKSIGKLERLNKRPIFYEFNLIHRNPGGIWTLIVDIYAISLLLLAITGMFVIKGKNSFQKRGKWFVAAGFLFTIIMILLIN